MVGRDSVGRLSCTLTKSRVPTPMDMSVLAICGMALSDRLLKQQETLLEDRLQQRPLEPGRRRSAIAEKWGVLSSRGPILSCALSLLSIRQHALLFIGVPFVLRARAEVPTTGKDR